MKNKIAKRILKNQKLIMKALVYVIANQYSEDADMDVYDQRLLEKLWKAHTKSEEIIKKNIDCKCFEM